MEDDKSNSPICAWNGKAQNLNRRWRRAQRALLARVSKHQPPAPSHQAGPSRRLGGEQTDEVLGRRAVRAGSAFRITTRTPITTWVNKKKKKQQASHNASHHPEPPETNESSVTGPFNLARQRGSERIGLNITQRSVAMFGRKRS